MKRIPAWVWTLSLAGLIVALSTGGPVAVDYLTAAWMSSQNAKKWARTLSLAETTYGIPSGLLARIAYQESHFRQDIIDGTTPSSAGALGMMQLEPEYFQSVNRSIPYTPVDTSDQIDEAANFLSNLYAHFGDWTSAVAAYNAGQGKIDKVLAGKAILPNQTADYLIEVSRDLPDIVNPALAG